MIQSYLRKQEKFQINNLNLYLNELEKEENSTWKETIKIRAEMSEIQTEKKWKKRKKVLKLRAHSLKRYQIHTRFTRTVKKERS